MILINNILQFMIIIIKSIRSLLRGSSNRKWHPCKKKVLILGNGPSLKETAIDEFINDSCDIACVNYFPVRSNDFFDIKPKYIILLDPIIFDNPDECDNPGLIRALEKVTWNLTIVTLQGMKLSINNPKISYDWICRTVVDYNYMRHILKFLYNRNILYSGAQNVMVGALYYFIANKAKYIWIAGLDMSEFRYMLVDENNDVWRDSCHFYVEKKESMTALEKRIGRERYYFHDRMEDYARGFKQFYLISLYAKDCNVVVKNLSPYSYVDVFEKTTDYITSRNAANGGAKR